MYYRVEMWSVANVGETPDYVITTGETQVVRELETTMTGYTVVVVEVYR